jgi:hypothetical protein
MTAMLAIDGGTPVRTEPFGPMHDFGEEDIDALAEVVRFQLFDVAHDPNELVDLAEDDRHRETRGRLTELLIENLYGSDEDWLAGGELVGVQEPEATGRMRPRRDLGGQRGLRFRQSTCQAKARSPITHLYYTPQAGALAISSFVEMHHFGQRRCMSSGWCGERVADLRKWPTSVALTMHGRDHRMRRRHTTNAV